MPRVRAEEELRTLTECQYSYPVETLYDLQKVRSLFSDLRLYVEFYCFPHKEKKKLVYLAGTVPVHYEGNEYNIPVCIWLHETHPVSRPRCYVCPSVSMVINPSCPCVDTSGNISLDGLKNWTQGVSNLSLLVAEMRRAFQKDTPLYAGSAAQDPPLAASNHIPPQAPPSCLDIKPLPLILAGSKLEQTKKVKVGRSYTEELLGIDFSAPPASSSSSNNLFVSSFSSSSSSSEPLSRMMGALRLDRESSTDQKGEKPVGIIQSEAARDRRTAGVQVLVPVAGRAAVQHEDICAERLQPGAGEDHIKMATHLPPDQAAIFLSLMTMEEQSFTPGDVLEAVQLNRDFSSALKFLTHSCPICQEQVSFSKIITMTHCYCFLCQTCFKTFFSVAIKEKSIEQLVCPQCGRPEIKRQGGMEESMDYFNLLDTQIRHFLPPHLHELFQRKLRDRALQEMPNFRWCAHCSFGMLHEADRLRMDCPSCRKSTCCQCRSAWSPQHQGLSCQQFRRWQQQNQPDQNSSTLLRYNSIVSVSISSVEAAARPSAPDLTKGLHAHHPRDCLYHLRDWSVPRLHLLLQYYRMSPAWFEPANGSSPGTSQTGVCLVLELRDDGSRREQPCGRPAAPEHGGYCQAHYKEHLVELINRCHGDPAVLFSPAEMRAELQRWNVAVPTRKPDEPEVLYAHRLRMTLTNRIPLRKQRCPPLKPNDNLCPLTSAVAPEAPPPHMLMSD
ncbi:E3 ubiquitin-protein ligase RNF31 isoform X5 [Sparus aurata]|uniref:E3 ubiquitin-protein ligase RNF31 isoform X5 n=1 Tax=Sparus aurata TaxID=8175 RepID=UPI0011C0DD56|nr:E3 ubiquitin-protein ligase RNF31-like isoform X5 [Sparus aurata]